MIFGLYYFRIMFATYGGKYMRAPFFVFRFLEIADKSWQNVINNELEFVNTCLKHISQIDFFFISDKAGICRSLHGARWLLLWTSAAYVSEKPSEREGDVQRYSDGIMACSHPVIRARFVRFCLVQRWAKLGRRKCLGGASAAFALCF